MKKSTKRFISMVIVTIMAISLFIPVLAVSGTLGTGGSYATGTNTIRGFTEVRANANFVAVANITTSYVFRNPNNNNLTNPHSITRGAGGVPGGSVRTEVTASSVRIAAGHPSNFVVAAGASVHSGSVNHVSSAPRFTFSNVHTHT